MFCWNCGTKNADQNKFCGECGRKLARSADVVDATEPPARPSRPVTQMPERGPAAPTQLPPLKATGPQPARPITPESRPPSPPVRGEPRQRPEPPRVAEPQAPTRIERTEPIVPSATFAAPPPPMPVNPVTEEPRVVHERPVVTTPVAIETPRTLSAMQDETRKPMVLT